MTVVALAATSLPGALSGLLTCAVLFSTIAATLIKWRRAWLALEREASRTRSGTSIAAAQQDVLAATTAEMQRRLTDMPSDQLLALWSSLTRNEPWPVSQSLAGPVIEHDQEAQAEQDHAALDG